jgi:hypothetical protein
MKRLDVESENHKKYHIPGCPAYVRRPRNAVYYNAGSTTKHELCKAIGGLMLQKYGDIKFNELLIDKIEQVAANIDILCKDMGGKADFLTECVPNNEGNRRVDLLRLRDEVRFEFETNHKVLKAEKLGVHTVTIYI